MAGANGLDRTVADQNSLRLLLVEPNEVARRGLHEMLSLVAPPGDTELDIVTSTSSVDSATAVLAGRSVDVILFPCDIGQSDGAALVAAAAPARALVLLRSTDAAHLTAAINLPVHGFVLESTLTVSVLERALAQMVAGEVPIPTALVQRMLSEVTSREPSKSFPMLSPREREVLTLLVAGFSNKQIARSLCISEHGAKRHVANVLMKLNCANRTQAVAQALRNNLVPDPK